MAFEKKSHYKEVLMDAIIDIAKENDKVVFLDADLSSCIGSTAFEKVYAINCGLYALFS